MWDCSDCGTTNIWPGTAICPNCGAGRFAPVVMVAVEHGNPEPEYIPMGVQPLQVYPAGIDYEDGDE